MKTYFAAIITGLCCLIGSPKLWAYDYDTELNFPNFKTENFLDIKSYQFRFDIEDEWWAKANGLRITGGSLDLDVLYILMAIRVQQELNDHIQIGYRMDHESFYKVTPFRQQFEIQFRLFDEWFLSGIGFPTYDKRHGEFGAAVGYGNLNQDYIRFAYLEQGAYYNEKNFENDRYIEEPVESRLEGAYTIAKSWKLRFNLLKDHPLERHFPDESLTFEHQGEEAKMTLEYHYDENARIGTFYRGFQFEKSRVIPTTAEQPENHGQVFQMLTTDTYWIRPIFQKHWLTLGSRYDRFRNLYRNQQNHTRSIDYFFDTWQVYGTWVQPWNHSLNMDYGLYIGAASESKAYLNNQDHEDEYEQVLEAKFRVTWDIHNSKNLSHWFITTTWNADNLFGDFWDGGSMSYQTNF